MCLFLSIHLIAWRDLSRVVLFVYLFPCIYRISSSGGISVLRKSTATNRFNRPQSCVCPVILVPPPNSCSSPPRRESFSILRYSRRLSRVYRSDRCRPPHFSLPSAAGLRLPRLSSVLSSLDPPMVPSFLPDSAVRTRSKGGLPPPAEASAFAPSKGTTAPPPRPGRVDPLTPTYR